MFLSRQVLSATSLIKNFRLWSATLSKEPQALLVVRKGSEPLVLVNASIFEGLAAFHQECRGSSASAGVDVWEEEEI